MAKYADCIYAAEEHEIGPITSEELQHVCTTCSHSAHGPDGFEHAGVALLSMEVYSEIADRLSLVEAGAPWPEGTGIVRAAFHMKYTI